MKILVLEDTEARIAWLRRAFPQADITWAPIVSSFLDYCMVDPGWDLVIMDHDLEGSYPRVQGMYGAEPVPDGTLAAREMVIGNWSVLIWSWNPDGAERMRDTLLGRLIDPAQLHVEPFGTALCQSIIKTHLRGGQ